MRKSDLIKAIQDARGGGGPAISTDAGSNGTASAPTRRRATAPVTTAGGEAPGNTGQYL